MKSAKKLAVAEQMERDHKILNRKMGELKIILSDDVSPKDFPNWRLECILELQDFKEQLKKHFALEEEGGFMNEVLQMAPETERQISKLLAEHKQMIKSLDEILSALKPMLEKDPASLETVRINLNEMMVTLRQHENAEYDLIQKAYYQQYGTASD
jgi:hemerythrin-like domain-containing protein